ncbi:hypothetical protein JTE90_026061 [Oedothorax gibbosus]|uniref:BPTI/Kunitz inhibitor domain-containing protein n=1 Tax=Oedothorax gibbosus TaxID=931172 RepID=A0AAV6UDT8_9ARAC|nr:hypothetical protein JTE90_026061 [Oedothorax gibbosus]
MTVLFIRLYNITHIQTFTQISPTARKDSPGVPIDVCNLRSQRGTCKNNIRRYFYHSFTGKCFEFIYSGCNGNENNFLTAEECMQRCGRTATQGLPVSQGNVCSFLPDRGNCRGNSYRYYYDKKEGKCMPFFYGGCSGNANRFVTEQECLQRCGNKEGVTTQSLPKVDKCSLQPERGSCRYFIRYYYFNTEKGTCEEFPYSGCDGNENRFSSEDLCMLACGRNKATTAVFTMTQTVEVEEESIDNTDTCDLPVARGTCNDNSQRYFFNNLSGQCVQFTYSGCGGNLNNFITEEGCQQRCGEVEGTEACVENEVYDTCGSACPLTCENYQQPPDICTLQCSNVVNNVGHSRLQDNQGSECPNQFSRKDKRMNGGYGQRILPQNSRKVESLVRALLTPQFRIISLSTGINPCEAEKSIGPCNQYKKMYYFNKSTGLCEEFTYSGCGGNGNSFLRKEYCDSRCVNKGQTT